jgi:hypothetical protein
MTTYRTQQRLNVNTSKTSINSDTFLKVNLDGKERILPPDEINKIVDVGERFNIERQRGKFYRILGTINPTISNVLFNLEDSVTANMQTWKGFNEFAFVDTSYPKDNDVADDTDSNYAESIKDNLKRVNGWFGYTDPDKTKSAFCNYIDMEPTRQRFSFVPDLRPYHSVVGSAPVKNWELTISYPYNSDKIHPMVKDGLLIVEAVSVVVATKTMTAFGMSCLHNLGVGDTVKIVGTNGYDGTHSVVRTGLDNGDLKAYYFVLDLAPTGTVDGNSKMKRVVSGKESEYYFRIFKKIKTRSAPMIETDDYETYKLAFSENIYNDEITQYVFNEDIDITDLVDNLGRPLSELYLTKVKTSSNGLFTKVSSGIETPYIPKLMTSNTNTYLKGVPTINRIHNGGSLPFPTHTPLETNITINDSVFYGDLVEYNMYEVQEIVLAEVSHRFNTVNRETSASLTYYDKIGATPTFKTTNLGPRQEGYFYKAHNLIKIREFSTYVEQGDSSTIDIPSYAVDLLDGRYLWRDLLDIGYNQSDVKPLDYPFMNGCHYMYQNDCFLVRRQDAFDNWGLYYGKFPSDPLGDRMTDKYIINSEDDVC